MKVDFLIVGTQKGGTTALSSFISKHPQIGMAKKKEVHFFDNDRFFNSAPPDYAAYHRYFERTGKETVFGEATPIYMYWRSAAERIKRYNPRIKLIFLLRNPIERAYSHYIMELKRGCETWSFFNAIRFEKLRCLTRFPKQHRRFSYIDRGYYTRQIRRMSIYFPREQMLFLKTEDLRENHQESLSKVFDFLGVEAYGAIRKSIVFSKEYSPMAPKDKRYLVNKFHMEIKALERLLSWDCSTWKWWGCSFCTLQRMTIKHRHLTGDFSPDY